MAKIVESFLDGVDTFLAWLSTAIKQTTESYCDLQTADDEYTLVAHDGSLVSVVRIWGVDDLVGEEEFDRLQTSVHNTLKTPMSQPGHMMQVFFSYDKQAVYDRIDKILHPSRKTTERLQLDLDDLFKDRLQSISDYTADEAVFVVLWTRPKNLTNEQYKRALKEKQKVRKQEGMPSFATSQDLLAVINDLRETHDAFVRSVTRDFDMAGITTEVLEVHEALYWTKMSVEPDYTGEDWKPYLPGDEITPRLAKKMKGEISDVLWPPLPSQLMTRDGEVYDLRTVRQGDRIYTTVFIDLFPKEIQTFNQLFRRTLQSQIPWRLSFLLASDALSSMKIKNALASVLSWTSAHNRLIGDAYNLLNYIQLNTDDAVVKLQCAATTWADENDWRTLRARTAQLARALESWGGCQVTEVCGDSYEGFVSTSLAYRGESPANPSVASLDDVLLMMPFFRPSSPWDQGAILFRSPDGKLWPYQPGSKEQTTWIDLVYARPGSGKSVLANAVNLALCLMGGIQRLPRIAITDIGPSSQGLISLLQEALPEDQRHLVAYHKLRMTSDYSINPFDTQLGCRFPTPQERAFLVNFLTLLATPVGSDQPYDGITDMAGLVVDELYKQLSDDENPHIYTPEMEETVDGILEEIGFVSDQRTTWWEVTDALFMAGFTFEALLAQRHAMPLLADAASICRTPAIEDLYGTLKAPTGETLINAFARMISSAVREYPLLADVTKFDIGDARVVSLDLNEVARSGGDAADRQTAVMYMLSRYVLARHFYLTEDDVKEMPEAYQSYHRQRISEIREDPKRIVYDEFHRTSNAQAVRDQVIQDMREGRKWKVQISLLSQSLDDFDETMVEFATSVFIMDAGPEQAIKKSKRVFGLTDTAETALRNRVHGPREGGGTFLAQFATKHGINTQLLSLTLGPVELWAFNTTADDVKLRNTLYRKIGPKEARRVLSNIFPGGSATKTIEQRLAEVKEESGVIGEEAHLGVLDQLIEDILEAYQQNPDVKTLTF